MDTHHNTDSAQQHRHTLSIYHKSTLQPHTSSIFFAHPHSKPVRVVAAQKSQQHTHTRTYVCICTGVCGNIQQGRGRRGAVAERSCMRIHCRAAGQHKIQEKEREKHLAPRVHARAQLGWELHDTHRSLGNTRSTNTHTIPTKWGGGAL